MLLFSVAGLWAQKQPPVVIEGTAPFAAGQEIRLIVIEDLLTNTPKEVASDKIDKRGRFSLTFPTGRVSVVQLVIRTMRCEFLVAPSCHYELTLSADSVLFASLYPEAYGGFLHVRNERADSNELNYRINRFSHFFETLWQENLRDLVSFPRAEKFDTLSTIIRQHFPIEYAPNDFYKSYLYYTFANLEYAFFKKTPRQLFAHYFDNEYILYDNPAYMNFFNLFYTNYLYYSPRVPKQLLTEHINDAPNYLALFNAVGKDALLVNERLRELVIIKNLGEFYERDEFDQQNILTMLNFIKENTHFPEHQPIVANVIRQCARLKAGAALSDVVFKEASGVDFRLSKLKGKWVYVQLFQTSCVDCIREMLIINELQDKYRDSITFVSLSVDFNFQQFSQFRRTFSQFDWKFLHFNNHFSWLSEMEIAALPDYFLISPDGRLSQREAPPLDKGLAQFLLQKFTPEEHEENPLSPHK